jgi:hypothetical protein
MADGTGSEGEEPEQPEQSELLPIDGAERLARVEELRAALEHTSEAGADDRGGIVEIDDEEHD